MSVKHACVVSYFDSACPSHCICWLQAYDLVISRKFEYFMFFWVMASCGQMMAERPSLATTSVAYQVRATAPYPPAHLYQLLHLAHTVAVLCLQGSQSISHSQRISSPPVCQSSGGPKYMLDCSLYNTPRLLRDPQ